MSLHELPLEEIPGTRGAVAPDCQYGEVADVVEAGVEVHGHRELLFLEDAVPMFPAAVCQCAVGFPNVHLATQAAEDHVHNVAGLARESTPDGEVAS